MTKLFQSSITEIRIYSSFLISVALSHFMVSSVFSRKFVFCPHELRSSSKNRFEPSEINSQTDLMIHTIRRSIVLQDMNLLKEWYKSKTKKIISFEMKALLSDFISSHSFRSLSLAQMTTKQNSH